MNRAWIPAGALAGVSVAGLIALGPLTDSLNTQVTFQKSIAAAPQTSPSKAPASVPVSYNAGPVGDTSTAAVVTKPRGGPSATLAATSGDAGLVGYQKFHSTTSSTQTATSHTTSTATATPPATTKKAPKRQTTIGTIGEPNSDTGLAGGSKSATSLGEQSSTPAP